MGLCRRVAQSIAREDVRIGRIIGAIHLEPLALPGFQGCNCRLERLRVLAYRCRPRVLSIMLLESRHVCLLVASRSYVRWFARNISDTLWVVDA